MCAGEVVVDLVLRVPALPARGGDVVASSVTAVPGGATNVMLAARRQGSQVLYAGLLGSGPMAARAADVLQAEGVATALPPRPDRDTATVVTLVEPDGARTFVTTLGAEADLTDADLAAVPVGPGDVVYVSGYGLAYPRNGPCLARWVPTLPETVTVVLDPGPLVATVPGDVLHPVLHRVDWLTCDAGEGQVLAGPGAAQPSRSAVVLRRMVRTGVLVRDGAHAVTLCDAEGVRTVETFPVVVVDTNGAGDAHTGSFIAALLRADSAATTDDAVLEANAVAAITVSRHGPSSSPSRAEALTLLTDRGPTRPANG